MAVAEEDVAVVVDMVNLTSHIADAVYNILIQILPTCCLEFHCLSLSKKF